MFGFLNIDKPVGKTSRDVVSHFNKLYRWATGEKIKSGHAGTLDPIAQGVLVVALGKATKLIQFVQRYPKTYVADFQVDVRSDSDDTESELTPIENPVCPSREDLASVLPSFLGNIMQKPPAFSAISIGGKRAYELARKGVEFEIEAKPVHIHELEIVSYEYPKLTLKVTCGSGTYIRSLGRDIAKSIGSSAVMTGLVRTEIGPFKLEQAVDLDQVDFEQLMSALQPVGLAVDHLPTVQLHSREVQLLEYGGLVEVESSRVEPARISDAKISDAKISAAKAKSPDETGDVKPTEDSTIDTTPGEIAAMNELGELVAILAPSKGKWKPAINFVGKN